MNNKYKFTGQKALCLLVIVIVFTVSGCSNTGNSSNNYANITLDNYNSISYIKYSEVVKIFGREGKLLEAIPSQYNQSVTAYMIYQWESEDYYVLVKFACNQNKPSMSVAKTLRHK